jgi:hypothetical protein
MSKSAINRCSGVPLLWRQLIGGNGVARRKIPMPTEPKFSLEAKILINGISSGDKSKKGPTLLTAAPCAGYRPLRQPRPPYAVAV